MIAFMDIKLNNETNLNLAFNQLDQVLNLIGLLHKLVHPGHVLL